MIIVRNKSHGENIRVGMGIIIKYSQTLNKNTSPISTVHSLLSDRLLCWKEAILANDSFLGFLYSQEKT